MLFLINEKLRRLSNIDATYINIFGIVRIEMGAFGNLFLLVHFEVEFTLVHHVNEIKVGTYALNDYFVLKLGHCTLKDCAARVIATVVSDVVSGQVIIAAGSKTLSAKQLLRHENLEMGYIPEYPEARIFRLHEEHGWVDVSQCVNPPRIGQPLSIVPVNVALCINLFDEFYFYTNDGTLKKEKVDARGLGSTMDNYSY
jgi:D-serine deaminase-like pyridoxal phosphate-dependent protein